MATIYIYLLVDPFSKDVRYVGKTNNLERRYYQHTSDYELRNKTHKSNWIRSLMDAGDMPEMHVYAECDEDSWSEAEKETIRLYKSLGANLTNLDEGGIGASVGRKGITLGPQKRVSVLKRGLIRLYREFKKSGDMVRADRVRMRITHIQLTRPDLWKLGSVQW